MGEWVALVRADQIGPGQVKVAEVADRRIAVCNVDGALFAIDDVCTHDGGSLDQGELVGDQIECPRHGARFDVKTGRALTLPAVFPVQTYPIRRQDGEVEVLVE